LFFTTSDGVPLHFLECGKGPTIVFVPGWMMPAEIFQPQIDYFSKSFHVVAIDPRSQGESGKPAEGNYPGRRAQDYKEFIDHLGVSSVTLVAWSLAVFEALTYVEMYGSYKLSALVLIDFNIYAPPTEEERNARVAVVHQLQADRKGFTETFVRGMYRKPQSEEYLARIVAAALKTPTNSAAAMWVERAIKTDLRSVLPKFDMPVLAVMAPATRTTIPLIQSGAPHAQGEVFDDCGHCLFIDDANRFNTLLESFLDKVASSKPGSPS
jgi:non-heme chloroperoxidase